MTAATQDETTESAPTVLVVDDDPQVLAMTQRVLAQAALPCVVAQSGADALRLLESTPQVDVVLSDLLMPGVGGVELLRRIRERFADRPWLQLILITGHASFESAVEALRLDANDYLTKPVRPAELVEAIRRARRVSEAMRAQQAAPAERVPAPRTAAEEMELLKLMLRVEHERCALFSGSVEPEPSWEMLAELMMARLEGRRVQLTSLCLSSRHPVTTAFRRINGLVGEGLVSRVADPEDRRRVYVELSPAGVARMRQLLESFSAWMGAGESAAPASEAPASEAPAASAPAPASAAR